MYAFPNMSCKLVWQNQQLLWIIRLAFWTMFAPLSILAVSSVPACTWFVSHSGIALGFWLYVAYFLSLCSMCACLVFPLLDFESMFLLDLHFTLQYWDDPSSLTGCVRLPLYTLSKHLCRPKDPFMLTLKEVPLLKLVPNSGWTLSWKDLRLDIWSHQCGKFAF